MLSREYLISSYFLIGGEDEEVEASLHFLYNEPCMSFRFLIGGEFEDGKCVEDPYTRCPLRLLSCSSSLYLVILSHLIFMSFHVLIGRDDDEATIPICGGRLSSVPCCAFLM